MIAKSLLKPAKKLESSTTNLEIILLLLHRAALFAGLQALIAFGYALAGAAKPWQASIAWWPICAALTGAVSLAWQVRVERRAGRRWMNLATPERGRIGRDVLLTIGVGVVGLPLAMIPNIALSQALWGDPQGGLKLMLGGLPGWAAALQLVAFPLMIALSELPAYYGLTQPRLREQIGGLAAWLASSLFLSLQHVALPLIFDGRFLAWRAVMFLPFALWTGWVLDRRPRLMPYLMTLHFLMDFMMAWMVFSF